MRLRGRKHELQEVRERLAGLEAQLAGVAYSLNEELRPLLVALARDDGGYRRRLVELRASAEYELAFTEREPLVTVTIITAGRRPELMLERALPSALTQTYSHLEVVVVGDAAGERTRRAVQGVGDERVRFTDLTQRFELSDRHQHWLTCVTVARNEAHRLARGRWIADLDDDDALRPTAVAQLLALAQRERLEVAYGVIQQLSPTGESALLGSFPPAPAEPDWRERGLPYQPWQGNQSCGSLNHAGMRLFAREHIASELGVPGDFLRLERMLRAGVRFGMLDEIVYDYYPSTLWGSERG